MKLEAIWILTNLAYGPAQDIQIILENQQLDLLKALNKIMKESSQDIILIEQTLWMLGNIIGDNKEVTMLVIEHTEIFKCLSELIIKKGKQSRSLIRTICWVGHNLNNFRSPLVDQYIQHSVQIASEGLFVLDDKVKSDCLWILSQVLISEDESIIQLVSSPDILYQLCEAIASEDHTLFVPAVKAMGVILSTNDHNIIDRCLWANVLSKFSDLIESIAQGRVKGRKFVKEICWALSNLTASAKHHVEKFAESRLVGQMVNIVLDSSLSIDARKEALWVICNAITTAEQPIKYRLLESQPTLLSCLAQYCRPEQDQRLLLNVLESINDMLALDLEMPTIKNTDQSVAYNWERAGGIDALEEVQKHPNQTIYKASYEILEKYFEQTQTASTQGAQ